MQIVTSHRIYRISGITAAVVLAFVLLGTDTGRDMVAWVYLQSTDAIAKATHIHAFSLDRLDPTCPQCM